MNKLIAINEIPQMVVKLFTAINLLLVASCSNNVSTQDNPLLSMKTNHLEGVKNEDIYKAFESIGITNKSKIDETFQSKTVQNWLKDSKNSTNAFFEFTNAVTNNFSTTELYLFGLLICLNKENSYYHNLLSKLKNIEGIPPFINCTKNVVFIKWGGGLGHYGIIINTDDTRSLSLNCFTQELDKNVLLFRSSY